MVSLICLFSSLTIFLGDFSFSHVLILADLIFVLQVLKICCKPRFGIHPPFPHGSQSSCGDN
jgi:hypothetical protein